MSVQIDVKELFEKLKKEYEIVNADMIIAQASGAYESEVMINSADDLAAAFDRAIESGRSVGLLEGRLRAINTILEYLQKEVKKKLE